MPELPEVETVRRGLSPAMEGAVFAKVETRRGDLRIPLPTDFRRRLEGARVEALERRGKYILAPLSSGEALIMHLGMSGRFTIIGEKAQNPGVFYYAEPPDPAHDHVTFEMSKAGGARRRVIFNDPRRFGLMDLAPTAEVQKCAHFRDMGPEPTSDAFTPEVLSAALSGKSAPLKSALLDQRVVAGLGNIYVCEALHRAGISPKRRAGRLSRDSVARLHAAIRDVLEEAIAAGGSTLRDFAASDGALGFFQHRFKVYDREGDACARCGRPVGRIVQSGRSTFYCRGCQH